MDRVTEITKDGFNAVCQLRATGDLSGTSPEQLHARFSAFVDDLLRRATSGGFGREEANDLAYPVVALADEVILARGGDALREFWSAQPLQLRYFGENVAGEEFFTRLEAIRRDPRRAEIARAYYVALVLGFQGRYRVRGGDLELMGIVDGLARELARGRQSDADMLSPSGARPSGALVDARRAGPLLAIAGGALVLALVLYVGLRISLASGTGAVVSRIAATATP
ncbi:MAG TPA: DotU family type IV/VI secretion system protein [Anaeromyxobacteraceae bacterium]|nr:DotU family type IV/VI secretion system protein [Anaeromyxobacteraceae bacterium]